MLTIPAVLIGLMVNGEIAAIPFSSMEECMEEAPLYAEGPDGESLVVAMQCFELYIDPDNPYYDI
jgi:hypothetical protein